MFAAKSRANEFLLSSDAAVRRRRDLRCCADDLLETPRVRASVQPSAGAARPGRDLQSARRGAPFPGWQPRIKSRAQVPRTSRRLRQHFELRGQSQPAEGHRALGRFGGEQKRFAGPGTANFGQTIFPCVEKLSLPLQLSWPIEQTPVDQQFSVTLREAKTKTPQVRCDVRKGTGNERPARRSRLERCQTKTFLNRSQQHDFAGGEQIIDAGAALFGAMQYTQAQFPPMLSRGLGESVRVRLFVGGTDAAGRDQPRFRPEPARQQQGLGDVFAAEQTAWQQPDRRAVREFPL